MSTTDSSAPESEPKVSNVDQLLDMLQWVKTNNGGKDAHLLASERL
jgi:hypothetical protein